MNENTPSKRKDKIFQNNNELKLNSLNNALETNEHYNKLLTSKYNENLIQKYKVIAHQEKLIIYNNITESIPKSQNLYINTFIH